jgi:hypothetical protein
MLDDLRNQAGDSSLFGDDDEPLEFEALGEFDGEYQDFNDEASKPVPKKKKSRRFLGMTAFQRFVLSALLLGLSCVLSAMCLLLTESVMLPQFFTP